MAVSTQEPVSNMMLYLKKDFDTNRFPKVKSSLEVAMNFMEIAYNVNPDYESAANTDRTQLGLTMMSFEWLTKQNQVPVADYTSGDAEEFNWKGDKLPHKKMFVEAVEQYSRSIELNPKHPIYFYKRAISYCHPRNYDMCIDDCCCAIKLDSTYGGVWCSLGLAYYEKCKFIEARKAFLKAIEFIPTNISYRIYLEKIQRYLCNIVDDSEPGPGGTSKQSHPLNQSAKNASDSNEEYDYIQALTQQLISFVLDDGAPYYKLPAHDSDS